VAVGPTIGYTAGVFDLFHVGHLRLLRNARSRCDFLIVAVTTDALALEVKGSAPVVPLVERMDIVQSVRFVDQVVVQETMDKVAAWRSLRFDVVFVGDNLRGSGTWPLTESELANVGVGIEYLPHTRTHSEYLHARGLGALGDD
jgi:glycerol-3-phosphate cytidylyltransferase